MIDNSPFPFFEYGVLGKTIVFAHANGYPPGSYRRFLEFLTESFHIYALEMRPLWQKFSSDAFVDWQPLTNDLIHFIEVNSMDPVIGIGHSMGGTITLQASLQYPDKFESLVLIDPVIFPPYFNTLWNVICKFNLQNHVHPLIKSTKNRRKSFKNTQVMFDNYRTKKVFSRISDMVLWDYVNSMAMKDKDGLITLSYPPEWEALVYETSSKADGNIWQNLSGIQIPCMILKGADSNTFWQSTANRIKKIAPNIIIKTIPNAGHLLPLEHPDLISQKIKEFISSLG